MKAVNKFKHLLYKKHPELMSNVLGKDVPMVQPPLHLDSLQSKHLHKSQSVDPSDRRPVEGALVPEVEHRKVESPLSANASPPEERMNSGASVAPSIPDPRGRPATHHRGEHTIDIATPAPQFADTRRTQSSGEKGHARDPTDEAPLWLGIGVGGADGDRTPDSEVIAESPSAAEFNIYDTAYENEVKRIRKAQGSRATIYLTRRVDHRREHKEDGSTIEAPNRPYEGWKDVLDAVREKESSINKSTNQSGEHVHDHTLISLATQAGETVKAIEAAAMNKEHELRIKGGTAIANLVRKAMDNNSKKVQEG
jgi:calcium/calmodulin-dependent protein kinase kinase 2